MSALEARKQDLESQLESTRKELDKLKLDWMDRSYNEKAFQQASYEAYLAQEDNEDLQAQIQQLRQGFQELKRSHK